jgi:hypothetical protein
MASPSDLPRPGRSTPLGDAALPSFVIALPSSVATLLPPVCRQEEGAFIRRRACLGLPLRCLHSSPRLPAFCPQMHGLSDVGGGESAISAAAVKSSSCRDDHPRVGSASVRLRQLPFRHSHERRSADIVARISSSRRTMGRGRSAAADRHRAIGVASLANNHRARRGGQRKAAQECAWPPTPAARGDPRHGPARSDIIKRSPGCDRRRRRLLAGGDPRAGAAQAATAGTANELHVRAIARSGDVTSGGAAPARAGAGTLYRSRGVRETGVRGDRRERRRASWTNPPSGRA